MYQALCGPWRERMNETIGLNETHPALLEWTPFMGALERKDCFLARNLYTFYT